MAIDDKFEAIQSVKRAEELTTSPVTSFVLGTIQKLAPILNELLPLESRISSPVLSTVVAGTKYLESLKRNRADAYDAALLNALHRQVKSIEEGNSS